MAPEISQSRLNHNMPVKYIVLFIFLQILICIPCALAAVASQGWKILQPPTDVTKECAQSSSLRFDISFGGGVSDSITLVLRTLSELDYECEIEIVTKKSDLSSQVHLLIAFRYPNEVGVNCMMNPTAIMYLKNGICYFLCDQVNDKEKSSKYYSVISNMNSFRFRFLSNSSLNDDMKAKFYMVTATSARLIQYHEKCLLANESLCYMRSKKFCFTNGVLCDGIKNCGVVNWYDEQETICEGGFEGTNAYGVPVSIAVILLCAIVIVQLTIRWLPRGDSSYFIFSTTEDNRLRVDPYLKEPDEPAAEFRTISVERDSASLILDSLSEERDHALPMLPKVLPEATEPEMSMLAINALTRSRRSSMSRRLLETIITKLRRSRAQISNLEISETEPNTT